MNRPTITYREFENQATKAHDELSELLHVISCETLPLMAANMFHEDQLPALAAALEVLKQMMARVNHETGTAPAKSAVAKSVVADIPVTITGVTEERAIKVIEKFHQHGVLAFHNPKDGSLNMFVNNKGRDACYAMLRKAYDETAI